MTGRESATVRSERELKVSSVNRTASELRNQLIEGELQPGLQLSEEKFSKKLEVGRNTLREAFRILTLEGLLVHQPNRGVFVRELTIDDVQSNYELRMILEAGAARNTEAHTTSGIANVRSALDDSMRCAEAEDWRKMGTAVMHFHGAIAGLVGIKRLDVLMRQLLAEIRLAQSIMDPMSEYLVEWIPENENICRLIENGRGPEAGQAIERYLMKARSQLVTAMNELHGSSSR